MRQSSTGIRYLFNGLSLILQPGLRRFVILPVLINIAVFAALIWYGGSQFDQFMAWLLPEDAWYSFLRFILWPLFAASAVLVGFFTFSLVANLIASPFNNLLAKKVEEHLTGIPLTAEQAELNFTSSIANELRKLSYFISRAIPVLLLFLIPVVQLAAPFIWFLFSAWMLTLQYTDFTMANHNLTFDQQRLRLRQRRLPALGFGTMVSLMTMIPFVNFLAMPSAVAGGTKMWVDDLRRL